MARNARTAAKAPRIPEPWELAKAGNARVQVMHSRTHGVVSTRTRRRQDNAAIRRGEWDR